MKLSIIAVVCVFLLPSLAVAQGSWGSSSQSIGVLNGGGSEGNWQQTTTTTTFVYSEPETVYVSNDGPRFRLFPRFRQRGTMEDCGPHLVQDHGLSPLRVAFMPLWVRERKHNQLHGGG